MFSEEQDNRCKIRNSRNKFCVKLSCKPFKNAKWLSIFQHRLLQVIIFGWNSITRPISSLCWLASIFLSNDHLKFLICKSSKTLHQSSWGGRRRNIRFSSEIVTIQVQSPSQKSKVKILGLGVTLFCCATTTHSE